MGNYARIVAVVAAVLLFAGRAIAGPATQVCERENGQKVRVDGTTCRPVAGLRTPTPAPTATPVPTASRRPGNPCPDGDLNTPASKTDPWYGVTVDIPEGVTKTFCAPVREPLVKGHPNQITLQWYEVRDQDCGALNVSVYALDPPARPRGGPGWSSSGQYFYSAKVGSGINAKLTPEQTAPGIYVITAIGGPSSNGCSRFRIAWRVS